MTVDRKISSIESGFQTEGMTFDEEKDVLEKNMSVADAIAELNRKYSVLVQKNGGSRV